MENAFYTDLAEERRSAAALSAGYCLEEKREGVFAWTLLEIQTEEAASAIQKPIGRYHTLSFPSVLDLTEEEREALSDELAEGLWRLSPRKSGRVLAVGLGNRTMTADAVGPLTADGILATAHLKAASPDALADLPFSLFVTVPGVTAQSGMDTLTALSALAFRLSPDLILAIDALAAREPGRLLRTVQLCDTGVAPGSGLGRGGDALSEETLGVPVLALGVPTVISAPALLEAAGGKREALSAEAAALFVSPGTLDAELSLLTPLLAKAINRVYGIEGV
ncbi:MAG: GPR endopeptidase [Clostridia bacterium]|nr:GPR endopeptidase [Clostridia bacterium]